MRKIISNIPALQAYRVLLMVLLSREFLTFDFIPLLGGVAGEA